MTVVRGTRYTNYTNAVAASWSVDMSGPWTVCGWLHMVANTGGEGDLFYTQGASGFGGALWLGYEGGPNLRWRLGDGIGGVFTHTPSATTGVWYHLAATYDGTTARFYLDATEVAAQAITLAETHDYAEVGDFGFGTTTIESAQIKVWVGAALSASELASERDYHTPHTSLGSLYAWLEQRPSPSDPTADSSGNGHSLTVSGSGNSAGSIDVPGDLEAPSSGDNASGTGNTTSGGAAASAARANASASAGTLSGGAAATGVALRVVTGGDVSSGGSAAASQRANASASGGTASSGAAASATRLRVIAGGATSSSGGAASSLGSAVAAQASGDSLSSGAAAASIRATAAIAGSPTASGGTARAAARLRVIAGGNTSSGGGASARPPTAPLSAIARGANTLSSGTARAAWKIHLPAVRMPRRWPGRF